MAIHAVVRKRGYDPIALSPWYFPSVQEYRKVRIYLCAYSHPRIDFCVGKLLESSGFEVKEISLNPRFTPLTTDIIGWQQTFCRNVFYANMSDEEAESIMKEVQDMCEVDMKDSEGNWALMYTRLRLVAFLK